VRECRIALQRAEDIPFGYLLPFGETIWVRDSRPSGVKGSARNRALLVVRYQGDVTLSDYGHPGKDGHSRWVVVMVGDGINMST
jgi:hypothetical protein